MIVGFCFRSPEVVKFLVPATKYSVCIVPDKPIMFEQIVPAFRKQPIGSRKRVYMHKSLASMVMYFNKEMMDSTKDLHVVFDAFSVLSTKPCVKILDVDTKADETWQLKKTIPLLLEKVLGGLREGVAKDDLECLRERTVLPEDLITTDRKVDDIEKQNKVKSFLHVLQDIQSKNADKRDIIGFWMSAFYVGAVTDKDHVIQKKKITGKWTEGRELACRVYAEKTDKTARQRMMAFCVSKLKDQGFELKKHSQNKMLELLGTQEHVTVMRALWLMENLNWAPEKSAHATGANISALVLIHRSLNDRSSIVTTYMKNKQHITGISMPKKMLKQVKGIKKPESEVVQDQDAKKTGKAPVKHAPNGLWTVLELLKHAGLVPDSKTMPQALGLSKTTIKVEKANKYVVQGTTKYKVIKGKTLYIRFNGAKHKIVGS